MSRLSPGLEAALSADVATIFGAVEIALPDHSVRLLAGSGVVTFGGRTFRGEDATFGALHAIDDLTDGGGDEAPALSITLSPASDAAAAALASPDMQGSPVSLWLGAINPTTGLIVDEPLLVFLGALDVPTLRSGSEGRYVDLEVTSAFEDFFFSDDGARLSPTYHDYVWPGERGLAFVTGVVEQIYWGTDAPSGVRR